MALGALVLAACGGTDASSDDATATAVAGRTPAATATAEPNLDIFRGFVFPIEGACLPQSDLLMPNAPRDYRGGTHEGVDFYDVDNCTPIESGTPTIAAKDGRIVRADHDYTALTQEELEWANERIESGDANAFEVIDLFRGRQVWIDHGHGIVTRYAHLSGIPANVVEGRTVVQGEVVGYVGDSGTPESVGSVGTEMHLHWEVRVNDSFLGDGLSPEDVREVYENLFEQAP